jgi:hypothetical protein
MSTPHGPAFTSIAFLLAACGGTREPPAAEPIASEEISVAAATASPSGASARRGHERLFGTWALSPESIKNTVEELRAEAVTLGLPAVDVAARESRMKELRIKLAPGELTFIDGDGKPSTIEWRLVSESADAVVIYLPIDNQNETYTFIDDDTVKQQGGSEPIVLIRQK